MIDVQPKEMEVIKSLLARHVPKCEVRAFGSRINHTAKTYSDLDLAVVGTRILPDPQFYALKEAFEESDLPFRVDLSDWNRLSKEFQTVIKKNFIVIHPELIPPLPYPPQQPQ